MLAIGFFEMHNQGGREYMWPLTLLFILNIGLFIYMIISFQKKMSVERWLEIFKQVGALILALGFFGTLTGFFQIFDALEATKEDLPRQVISGGVKVAFLPITYGFALFSINHAVYILLQILRRKQGQSV